LDTKRCFIAIKLPVLHDYANSLRKLIRQDDDIKISISSPENYHLTLHFFGDLTSEQITQVENKLSTISFNPFSFLLSDPGSFPKNKLSQTRVLFINIREGSEKIVDLTNRIRNELELLGFKIEKRPYHPHLTIARIRYGKSRKFITQNWLNTSFDEMQVQVGDLELIESKLTSKGSKYTTISSYK